MKKQYWNKTWSLDHGYRGLVPTKELPWDIYTHDPALAEALISLELSGKALELGCGSGFDTKFMTEQGLSVTAMDISDIAIDIAKANNKGNSAKFIVGDIKTDIPNEKFDLVYDRGCLHNNPKLLEATFKKLHELLNPNGKIILITGNDNETCNTLTRPNRTTISEIEIPSANYFTIKLVKEITFYLNKNYGDGLGWLFILERKP